MSNELTTQAYNNLVAYNPKTSLVEVRLNPDKYPRIGLWFDVDSEGETTPHCYRRSR